MRNDAAVRLSHIDGSSGGRAPAYAGSDTCLVCHEDITNAFASNPHHALESDTKRGPEGGWKGKT